jgi:serine/threonine-protein kinase HipA
MKIRVYNFQTYAGYLEKIQLRYIFTYDPHYRGPPISLTMPVTDTPYEYQTFPPFFDGLLPEGWQLDSLLKIKKIDQDDYMTQLVAVGQDLPGSVVVSPW